MEPYLKKKESNINLVLQNGNHLALMFETCLAEGGIVSDTAGGNFTPHVLTVNTGEVIISPVK